MTTAQLEYFEKECKEDFKTIKASLDAFNIFEVLKIHRREIRHSNFLGWLFDPNGSHNLGDIFLKELIKLLNKGEKYQINVLDKSLNNTIVFRESKGNIDVLIINETLGFSICIENKIGARFSKTQLEKYYKYVHRNYDHLTNKVFITLTPSLSVENFSTEEEIDIYQNITYKNLINAFENLGPDIEKAKVSVADSIKQYIAVHKKHIVKNSEELLLARKLYLKYKGEIDYIIASRPDFRKKVKDVEKAFKDDFVDGLEILPEWKPKHIFRILPKNENLKKLYYFPQAKAWNGDYIFAIELFLNKEVVWLKWCFADIRNAEAKNNIQPKKTMLFNEMKALNFKKNDRFVYLEKSKPESDYPAIGTYHLFNAEDFMSQDLDFIALLKQKLEYAKKDIIDKWTKECLENLTQFETNE